jgi:hypothetical protein
MNIESIPRAPYRFTGDMPAVDAVVTMHVVIAAWIVAALVCALALSPMALFWCYAAGFGLYRRWYYRLPLGSAPSS